MPSAVVSSYSYDADTRRLTIVFTTGLCYAYKEVPEEVYLEMKNSFAKGIFFNQHIKGKYAFERIEDN